MPLLHQTWPSHNRFCCNCCITGPSSQYIGIICIYCCTFAILIPLCIIIIPTTWQISPALPLILFLSIIATTLFIFLTACTDPGIIPRRPYLESNRQKYKQFLVGEAKDQKKKFCQTCHIFRPPRASHCSTCQNCVQIFDHHCGFIGNCIGKRNYRFFVLFLGSASLTLLMVVGNVVAYIVKRKEGDHSQIALIVLVSIFGIIVTMPVTCFFIFHLFLQCTGNTTRQLIKDYKFTQTQNQWCGVDSPLFDPFEAITEMEKQQICKRIEEMRQPMQNIGSADANKSQKQMGALNQ